MVTGRLRGLLAGGRSTRCCSVALRKIRLHGRFDPVGMVSSLEMSITSLDDDVTGFAGGGSGIGSLSTGEEIALIVFMGTSSLFPSFFVVVGGHWPILIIDRDSGSIPYSQGA